MPARRTQGRQRQIGLPGQQDAAKGEAVVEGEDAPLFRGRGPHLHEAGDGDEIEPSARPGGGIDEEEQREAPRLRGIRREGHEAEQEPDAEKGGREQGPPAFGRAPGREERARTDADHEGHGQEAGDGVGQAEFAAPEGVDFEEQQGGQGIEEGFGPDGEVKGPVPAGLAQMPEGVHKGRPREGPDAPGAGPRFDEEGGHEPGGGHEDGHGRDEPAAKGLDRIEPRLIKG